MKKFIASAVIGLALVGASAPSLAQPYRAPHHGPAHVQHVTKKVHVTRKVVVVKKQRWQRGHALPAGYRRNYVGNYHRHHLHAPGPGQRWVRVDNQFILINAVTGMIAALAAAR